MYHGSKPCFTFHLVIPGLCRWNRLFGYGIYFCFFWTAWGFIQCGKLLPLVFLAPILALDSDTRDSCWLCGHNTLAVRDRVCMQLCSCNRTLFFPWKCLQPEVCPYFVCNVKGCRSFVDVLRLSTISAAVIPLWKKYRERKIRILDGKSHFLKLSCKLFKLCICCNCPVH